MLSCTNNMLKSIIGWKLNLDIYFFKSLIKLATRVPPRCNVRCGFPLQIRHHNIYLQTNLKSLPFLCNFSCPAISKKSSKMSAPAASRQLSAGRDIPSKRVTVNDPSQLPHDYSTTPGGTLFSTTPGGAYVCKVPHVYIRGALSAVALLALSSSYSCHRTMFINYTSVVN